MGIIGKLLDLFKSLLSNRGLLWMDIILLEHQLAVVGIASEQF